MLYNRIRLTISKSTWAISFPTHSFHFTSQRTQFFQDFQNWQVPSLDGMHLSYNKSNNYYPLWRCLERNLHYEVRFYCFFLLLFYHLHTQFSFKCRLNLPLWASCISDLKILYLDIQIHDLILMIELYFLDSL